MWKWPSEKGVTACIYKSKAVFLIRYQRLLGKNIGENKLFQTHLPACWGRRHCMPTGAVIKPLGNRWEVLPCCFDWVSYWIKCWEYRETNIPKQALLWVSSAAAKFNFIRNWRSESQDWSFLCKPQYYKGYLTSKATSSGCLAAASSSAFWHWLPQGHGGQYNEGKTDICCDDTVTDV